MYSQLIVVFGWPYGIVVGNLLASLILWTLALLLAFLNRERLMPKVVAFVHRHHLLHLEKLNG